MPPVATLEQIQEMLKDLNNGHATRNETIKVLETRLEEIESAAKAGVDLSARIDDLEKVNKSMYEQIKNMISARDDHSLARDPGYKGIWNNERQARDFGLYIIANFNKNSSAAQSAAKKLLDRGYVLEKDMDVQSNADGAALIMPAQFMGVLGGLIEHYGVYRQEADSWPMSGDEAIASVPASLPLVYAPGAGKEPTKSNPGFQSVHLRSRKLMTLTAIDSELVEDVAVALGEKVGHMIAKAFAYNEDLCGFMGDGSSTYFGFVGLVNALMAVDGTPANIKGLRIQETAGAWSKISIDDLLALPGLILDSADNGNAKWYPHRNFYYTVMIKAALAAGGTRATEVTNTAWTQNPSFEGRPVRFTQAMPRVKANADHVALLFGDLKQAAVLGDRKKATIDQDTSIGFATDQTYIRGIMRVGMSNNHGVGSTAAPGAVTGLLADIA